MLNLRVTVDAVHMRNKLVAAGCDDNIVRLFMVGNTPMKVYLLEKHKRPVTCVAFNSKATLLASGSRDLTIVIWNVATYRPKHILTTKDTYPHRGLVWLPDNDQLVSFSWDSTAILWSAESGQQLRIFRGHTGVMHAIAVSPNGQRIATASGDSTLRLWRPDSDQQQAELSTHTHYVNDMAFYPNDSNMLLSCSENLIVAHDLSTLTAVFQLEQGAYKVCWTPNGRFFFILECHTNNIKLWDATSQRAVAKCDGNPKGFYKMMVSTDQNQLVAISKIIYFYALPWFAYVDPLTVSADQVNALALLHKVLLNPRDDIITFFDLLRKPGVDVNAQDHDDDTPLHVAMHLENTEAVQALKKAGADQSILNAANRTACQPISIFGLLPPELWAYIVIDFCPILSIQSFSYICREARHLLVAERGGYAHRVLARRGLTVVMQIRSLPALRLLLNSTDRDRIRARLQQEEHLQWPEALALIQQSGTLQN